MHQLDGWHALLWKINHDAIRQPIPTSTWKLKCATAYQDMDTYAQVCKAIKLKSNSLACSLTSRHINPNQRL
jgi:hypothetical protein